MRRNSRIGRMNARRSLVIDENDVVPDGGEDDGSGNNSGGGGGFRMTVESYRRSLDNHLAREISLGSLGPPAAGGGGATSSGGGVPYEASDSTLPSHNLTASGDPPPRRPLLPSLAAARSVVAATTQGDGDGRGDAPPPIRDGAHFRGGDAPDSTRSGRSVQSAQSRQSRQSQPRTLATDSMQSMRSVNTLGTVGTVDTAASAHYANIDVGRDHGTIRGRVRAVGAHGVHHDAVHDDEMPYSVDLDEFDRYVARVLALNLDDHVGEAEAAAMDEPELSAEEDGSGSRAGGRGNPFRGIGGGEMERLTSAAGEASTWSDATKFWLFVRSMLEPADLSKPGEEERGSGFGSMSPMTNRRTQSKPLSSSSGVIPRTWSYSHSLLRRYDALSVVRPIHPAQLARSGNFSRTDVLTELLRATAVGLVSLRWVQVCQGCGVSLDGVGTDDLGRICAQKQPTMDTRSSEDGDEGPAAMLCRICRETGRSPSRLRRGSGSRSSDEAGRRESRRSSTGTGAASISGDENDVHERKSPRSSLALDRVRVVFVLSPDVLHVPEEEREFAAVTEPPGSTFLWTRGEKGAAGRRRRVGRARATKTKSDFWLSKIEGDGRSIVAAAPPNPAGLAVRYTIGCCASRQQGNNDDDHHYDDNDDDDDDDDDDLGPALEPGTYRIKCLLTGGVGRRLVVKGIEPDGAKPIKLRFRASSDVGPGGPGGVPGAAADGDDGSCNGSATAAVVSTMAEIPHGKIILDIIPDTDRLVVVHIEPEEEGKSAGSNHLCREGEGEDHYLSLSENDDDGDNDNEEETYTTASHVLCNGTFQLLFPSQLVSSDPTSLLSLQNAIIVFTDVVGATDLAETLGEGAALELIRQHYQVLFSTFARRGRVVKTVGDKVMTTFTTGRAAIEAAAKALRRVPRRCAKPDGTPLTIRLAIHRGPAVVVPLNGMNDYFGQTVNIAARVGGAAGPSECLITDAVLRSDPGACAMYRKLCKCTGAKFEATPEAALRLKGLSDPLRVRGFRLSRLPSRKVVVDLSGKESSTGKSTSAVLTAEAATAARSMRSVMSAASSSIIDLNGNRRRRLGGPSSPEGISVDLAVFDSYIRRLSSLEKRRRRFNSEVWTFVRSCLGELETTRDYAGRGIALLPINPVFVSVLGGFREEDVLTELFHAAKIGLVGIRWVPCCGECDSSLGSQTRIGKMPSAQFCDRCGIDHKIDCIDSIKVVFDMSSDVLTVPAKYSDLPMHGESTKATTVLHHDLFYELFPNQVVSSKPDVLLSVRNVVFVFTDIVGSTDMYGKVGDGAAFRIVRQHFQVLFRAITHRGRVVKTIGDAVMASFNSGKAAIEAAAEALSLIPLECRLPDSTPLQIRIGIHSGPSIIVPLNGVNDYFGRTVNIASRVEGAAKSMECLVTESVFSSDPEAQSAYNEICADGKGGERLFRSTPVTELNLEGMSESIGARGFRLITRQRRTSSVSINERCRIHSRSQDFEMIEVGENDGSSTPGMIQSDNFAHRRSSGDSLGFWAELSQEED